MVKLKMKRFVVDYCDRGTTLYMLNYMLPYVFFYFDVV